MQETQEILVQSLGWEDSREEEMAMHSSILAWRIPWTEEPGGCKESDIKRENLVDTDVKIGEGSISSVRL